MKKQIAFYTLTLAFATAFAVPADNSAVNQRDKMAHEYTADQQGTSRSDIEITQKIRRALMKENALSTYAKNIKIITVGGEVTLKGPVRSHNEQNILLEKAQGVAGVTNVYNQTDIAKK